ncbi:hypothetical protein [Saccharopolyspora sp. 6V]|uniref:hypothetical protein n=1 Tax=Saccharopolyspora sp. 6V TaxID=2877239 RepID=UPI001CD6DF82|nr:hypothetical protein [Saccharopolyspora sp. 6V]MCA1196084.1 hypothetical protein [Saccharopolyspora sp. 6V]
MLAGHLQRHLLGAGGGHVRGLGQGDHEQRGRDLVQPDVRAGQLTGGEVDVGRVEQSGTESRGRRPLRPVPAERAAPQGDDAVLGVHRRRVDQRDDQLAGHLRHLRLGRVAVAAADDVADRTRPAQRAVEAFGRGAHLGAAAEAVPPVARCGPRGRRIADPARELHVRPCGVQVAQDRDLLRHVVLDGGEQVAHRVDLPGQHQRPVAAGVGVPVRRERVRQLRPGVVGVERGRHGTSPFRIGW